MNHPFMTAVAEGLAGRSIATLLLAESTA